LDLHRNTVKRMSLTAAAEEDVIFLPPTSVEVTSLAQTYLDVVQTHGLKSRQAGDAYYLLYKARVAYRATITEPDDRADDEYLWDCFGDDVIDMFGGT
jgi:hypothetical protein